MGSKYPWKDFDREEARQQKERRIYEATLAKEVANQIRLGKQQRREVTNDLIIPFLTAMRLAGNPGSGWRGVWSDGMPKKQRKYSHAYGTPKFYDVYTTGKWLMGAAAGTVGSRDKKTIPGWIFSSDFGKEEIKAVNEYSIRSFQAILVSILREYDVPLPPD